MAIAAALQTRILNLYSIEAYRLLPHLIISPQNLRLRGIRHMRGSKDDSEHPGPAIASRVLCWLL